ncbi:hypothetical protein [Neisseria iguanae]|uniref:Uncharacterized protein n=1 Tax=Neisseria iguanae TaxID=90242 RepID=A0A2P7U2K5_9NEIS|nr:hypothetical protein [Neisseria iguanae]PSJ81175.1 hypothetical protein C7N83_01760 [Neisseria iguanae]
MKKLSFYSGLAFLLLFLCSGYYLLNTVLPQFETYSYIRMQNRANHIYLLLIALLNISCGRYVPIQCWLQKTAALLLFAAGLYVSLGFFVESTAAIETRMLMPGGRSGWCL